MEVGCGRDGYRSIGAAGRGRRETIQEGGSRGGYRSRGATRGGSPRRYRRAEVKAAIEVEWQTEIGGPKMKGGRRRWRQL